MTNKSLSFSLLLAFTVGFILTFAFPPPKEANAQVFGPTTRTPQLTVSPGATSVQNLTINGTCTGCPTSSPGGSTGNVQYNNAGAFGGIADGTSGQVLTSAGAGAAPTWTTPIAVTSGTFTANFDDGCTTTPAVTFKYVKIDTTVHLSWNSPASCTSDSLNFLTTAADIPAALRPTTTQQSTIIKAVNNGVVADALYQFGSTGTVTVQFCNGAGGALFSGAACAFNQWTNTGTKKVPLSGTAVYSTSW